jgi:hypothetical protein
MRPTQTVTATGVCPRCGISATVSALESVSDRGVGWSALDVNWQHIDERLACDSPILCERDTRGPSRLDSDHIRRRGSPCECRLSRSSHPVIGSCRIAGGVRRVARRASSTSYLERGPLSSSGAGVAVGRQPAGGRDPPGSQRVGPPSWRRGAEEAQGCGRSGSPAPWRWGRGPNAAAAWKSCTLRATGSCAPWWVPSLISLRGEAAGQHDGDGGNRTEGYATAQSFEAV